MKRAASICRLAEALKVNVLPIDITFLQIGFKAPSGINLDRRWPKNLKKLTRSYRGSTALSMWVRKRGKCNADRIAAAKSLSSKTFLKYLLRHYINNI